MLNKSSRRKFLQRSLSLAAGAAVAGSFEESNLMTHASQKYEKKVVTSASKPAFKYATLDDLKEKIPVSKIKDMQLSRVILGGNLIGGWAHARDLIYASKLVQAYHTKSKIWETMHLAEQCGVNTLLTNPKLCPVINEYWDKGYGKIQFISDCGGDDILTGIKKSIDNGATACYLHGGIADGLAKEGKWDLMAKALDLIKDSKLPAGIAGHTIDTIKGSVDHGLEPDFWMKTLHSHKYWSAQHPEEHDNVWCYDPEETIAYMRERKEPWIAFKTLAAGAIHPKKSFKWCYEKGADFLCVGMYDFQMVEDINLANDILSGEIKRERPWRA
ncbi:twin-arginine translocation signal domain-containing protein [candidate division KSB1 bacterium]